MQSARKGYSSIASDGYGDTPATGAIHSSKGSKSYHIKAMVGFSSLFLLGVLSRNFYQTEELQRADQSIPLSKSPIPLPKGVNLGAWLSLEDYFFVGKSGAIEVATLDGTIAGKCLPPLHVGQSTGPMWHSETDLLSNLTSMNGGSVKKTIKTFHAFRTSYLDWDEELAQMAKLGIHRVRVPISWCLTDFDPSKDDILGKDVDGGGGGGDDDDDDNELQERYMCLDPFFFKEGSQVHWPAIPRPFLASFLRACARHNIKATLDIHTYPGGTSIGTFSGVWPRKPLFWKYDEPEHGEDDFGRKLFRSFIEWIESLKDNDPVAFGGIGAITPMNEAAHLAGLYDDVESFLPSLPDHFAQDYLEELNANAYEGSIVFPDGPHLRVLVWLRDALSYFRSSSLPSNGIEIHVNIIESIFRSSLVSSYKDDADVHRPHATALFGAWWKASTSQHERAAWAVLDVHHYHAWDPSCQGAADGPPNGNYTCGDSDATEETLSRCTSWADVYRTTVNHQLKEDTARLASSEFSASTHHSVLHSCLDITTLHKTYLAQIEAANLAGIELYWWSWKMPHGGLFRLAWSFKQLMYNFAIPGFEHPDESEIFCE